MVSDPSGILWRASSRETVDAPPLSANQTVDLAIVGGGFTGCSAALEAAGQGASVCLLEGHIIGHGGSGRNAGLVNAGLWLPPDTVIAQMGESAGKRLIDILGGAPSEVFATVTREGIDCDAVNRGTLHLAHAPEGLKDIEERFRQGNRHGAPLRLIDAEETAKRTGTPNFLASLFDPRAGTIQPFAYVNGLARAAKAKGAAIHEHSPVADIRRDGDLWVLVSNGCEVRAKSLLMATNAYHFGIRTPFEPNYVVVSYSQAATIPLSTPMREKILAGGEGCWDTAMVMSSFRLDGAGRLIIGGMGDSNGPAGAIHKAWARRKLRALFPELGDLPFEHSWSGRIGMTQDHIPKIVEFGPNAYACFGYSGRGIAPGTVFGKRAAVALLQGAPEELPIAPIAHYAERFMGPKAAYYELGASLAHAISAR